MWIVGTGLNPDVDNTVLLRREHNAVARGAHRAGGRIIRSITPLSMSSSGSRYGGITTGQKKEPHSVWLFSSG